MAIKPPRLKKGDVVGIFSPSSYIDDSLHQQFNSGVEFLESLGLRVRIGRNVFCRDGQSAGTVRQRVDDLHDLVADKEVKAIIQSQGGGTARDLLPWIDWDLFRKNPKIFGGMSDGTHLLLGIYARTGLVTIHGPDLIWGYGRGGSPYEKANLEKLLFTGKLGVVSADPGHKVSARSRNSSMNWKCWRSGAASGPLVGGLLWVIQSLRQLNYMPDLTGSILFLETKGVDAIKLAADFRDLHRQGILKQVAGVILGYFDENQTEKPEDNRPIGEIFLEVIGQQSLPVLEIGEIGHNTANVSLPIGVRAHIDTDRLRFSVDEPALVDS